METREMRVIIGKAGGNAGNANTYKISLPNKWVKKMGIDSEHRSVFLTFDGEQIIIQNKL